MAESEVKIRVSADTAKAKANVMSFTEKVNELSNKWTRASEGFSKGLRGIEMMADAFAKGGISAAAFAKGLEGLPGAFGAVARAANAAADAVLAWQTASMNRAEQALLADIRVMSPAMEAARDRKIAQLQKEREELERIRAIEKERTGIYGNREQLSRQRVTPTKGRKGGGSRGEVWTDVTPSEGWTPWSNMLGGYLDKQSQRTSWGAGLGDMLESGLGSVGGAISGIRGAMDSGAAQKQAGISDKFLRDLQDNTKATGAAFSALSSGMAASVEAAITGSQSIGAAFKSAAAAALKATAVEASIKALYHTAAGVGSLALGPLGGVSAAGHFKAAGLYALTAVAAGAASAGLGGGGGGGYAGAGASGGGGYSRPAASSGGDNAPINIYIGEGFVGDEKKLGNEIHRAVRSARRSGGARDSAAISHD